MIHPLLAEMNGLETAALIAGLIFTPLSCLIAVIALVKKQQVKIDEPLLMKMEEQFVSAQDFKDLVRDNKHEHENLFKKIGGVERGAMERLDHHMSSMQKSAEEGREKIHRRLNRISIGLANLCGRIGAKMPTEEEES